MIQAIFISALFFSAFALGEERKFTSTASNNLRGPSEATATVEDELAEGILHGALAPLLALKASVPLKITQDSFTRDEDVETEGMEVTVRSGMSLYAETYTEGCVGGDWNSFSGYLLGHCVNEGGYNYKLKTVLGEKTTTVKIDLFDSGDLTCSGAIVRQGIRLERFNKCRPGGKSDNKGSNSITSALDDNAANAIKSTFNGLMIGYFLDSQCDDNAIYYLEGFYNYKCVPGFDKKGELSSYNMYYNIEEVEGKISVSYRVYDKKDSTCRLQFTENSIKPYDDDDFSVNSQCKQVPGSGFYVKALVKLPGQTSEQ